MLPPIKILPQKPYYILTDLKSQHKYTFLFILFFTYLQFED
jgi:hypothetical protein